MPTLATRAEVHRVMSAEAASPAMSAPIDPAMTAWPKAAFVMARRSTISG